MLTLAELAATSAAVGADPARSVKIAALAALLARADRAEAPVLAGLLAGSPRQGRVGVGWAGLSTAAAAPPATTATLTVLDVDRALDELAAAGGTGSTAARTAIMRRMFEAATEPEQDLLRRLLSGELHQGASEGLVVDGLAAAAGVPAALVGGA